MGAFFQDVRYALRSLRLHPGITVLAVICLGIGIGASTAIFSPVDVFMFRPLPYREGSRLVAVYLTMPSRGWTQLNFSVGDFRDHRAMSHTLDLAAYQNRGFNLSGGGAEQAERISGQIVSANFFHVLGTPPVQGRDFLPDEEQVGAPPVAILTHELWMNRFGGRPVLGTTIRLDGTPYTVVGILPAGFMSPNPGAQIFTPLPVPADAGRGGYSLGTVARLRPGATLRSANADLASVAARLAQAHPEDDTGIGTNAVPLWDVIFGREYRDGSAIVSVAVILLLLIGSANVANLLLARAADRGREIAVRTALGAGRRRIVTQLLTESVVLGVAGGVLGLGLAWAGIKGLLVIFPAGMPRVDQVGMDGRVLLFGLAVTLVAGVISGLAPALQASRQDLRESLQEGGRGAQVGRRSGRLRTVFVTSQMAFAVVLVIAAGLLVKGFVRMKDRDLGLDIHRVLTFRVTPPENKYPDNAALRRFSRDLTERMAALPGVEAAGLTSRLPFSGNSNMYYHLEGEKPEEGKEPVVSWRSVTPGYFQAVGIALRRGRLFTAADDSGSTPVLVVNEAFVHRHWPNGDALGQRIFIGGRLRRIVGVVANTREYSLDDPSAPAMVYLSAGQRPYRYLGVALRTAGDPTTLERPAAAAVSALDPDQPIYDVLPLDSRMTRYLQGDAILSRIMMVLAGVALVLSLVGVYGVMAYSVRRRTQEIGVRMALGAGERDVVGLVVRQGARVAGIGCGVGLVLALAVSRGLSVFLYGVSAFDPLTFGVVIVSLAAAAILASYFPARGAAQVDPVVALRVE